MTKDGDFGYVQNWELRLSINLVQQTQQHHPTGTSDSLDQDLNSKEVKEHLKGHVCENEDEE